jgi:hypothetical protein
MGLLCSGVCEDLFLAALRCANRLSYGWTVTGRLILFSSMELNHLDRGGEALIITIGSEMGDVGRAERTSSLENNKG